MKKIVIIINGRGGVGKDTLCSFISRYYKTINVSAITPIKQMASCYGWNGEKDEKSRRFLSELKRVFIEYNDLPNQYLVAEYKKFLDDDNMIMFVHIREKDQISKFIESVGGHCITLLVRSNIFGSTNFIYRNYSDDNVEDYTYDYYYDNNKPLELAEKDFLIF